jgi:hypothetical protein
MDSMGYESFCLKKTLILGMVPSVLFWSSPGGVPQQFSGSMWQMNKRVCTTMCHPYLKRKHSPMYIVSPKNKNMLKSVFFKKLSGHVGCPAGQRTQAVVVV